MRGVATYGTQYTLNGTALGLQPAVQYSLELIVFVGDTDYDNDNWEMKVAQAVRTGEGAGGGHGQPAMYRSKCNMPSCPPATATHAVHTQYMVCLQAGPASK